MNLKSFKRSQWLLLGLIAAYLVYALLYIYRSSYLFEGVRYFILNDDAMISMRYAHNLARGFGLLWNPGQPPVEGFTNPLWVVYMAVWHLLPIPLPAMSLPIQISGALFLALNLVFVYRIAVHFTKNELAGFLAVILTGLYEPLNNWGLLGMEVSLLVLLVNIAVWQSIQAYETKRFDWRPYAVLGFGTLVRFDMAVPFLAVLLVMLFFDKAHRRQHLVYGLGILAGALGSQTLLRLWYYGEPLPNTYYLKVAGIPLLVRVANGFVAFATLFWNNSWALALLPFTMLLFRRDQQTVLLVFLFAGQMAYSIYVGGDAWEHKGGANRYISLGIPLFFVLLIAAAQHILEALTREIKTAGWLTAQRVTTVMLLFFTLLSAAQFNSTQDVESSVSCCPGRVLLTTRAGWVQGKIEFTVGNQEYVRIVNALEAFIDDEASLAVVTAGVIPYFTDNPAIDLLGKNDAYIAHLDSHLPEGAWAKLSDYRPGHSKWDYEYSITQLRPDVIVQLWEDADKARAYMGDYVIVQSGEYTFSVLKDSTHIDWDAVTLVE
jgi:hypothetical protein